MKGRNELYRYFSGRISESLYRGRITDNPSVSEIRLCINSPVALRGNAGTKYLGINGEILSGNSGAVICGKTDIEYSFRNKKTKREEFLEIMEEIGER